MTDTQSEPTRTLPLHVGDTYPSLPDGSPGWGSSTPPSQPPKAPFWRRPWVVITGCVLVGVTMLGFIGSTMEPPAGDIQQPQPTVTAPDTTPVTKAPQGAVAVPETTDPPATTEPVVSQSEQLQAWWSSAEADATSLEENASEMGQLFIDDPYGVMLDPSEANVLLIKLQADVRNLKAHGPIPVAEINTPWQKSLRAYGKAFTLVYEGINEQDEDKIIRGSELMDEGNTAMGKATEELTRFTTS